MAAKPETTLADRALLVAARAWGGDAAPPWSRLRPAWREALEAAWPDVRALDPDAARERLRREHAATARPDLRQIHPTWLIRALQGESPSVRRTVVSHLGPDLRPVVLAGLGLAPDDLATDRPPRPESVRAALALWTERLVGDVPGRPDDPLIVRALTRLGPRELARLVRATALAKRTLAGEGPATRRRAEIARVDAFRLALETSDARVRALARRDVESAADGDRHPHARLGGLTVARLLAEVEPYRTRWALQHLPYPAAKALRALMAAGPRPRPAWLRWEEAILHAAWARLRTEGRLPGDGDGGAIA